jgi:hypothetical protein
MASTSETPGGCSGLALRDENGGHSQTSTGIVQHRNWQVVISEEANGRAEH